MGLDAFIIRKDRKPLGTPDEVLQRLSQSFPGAKFAIGLSGRWDGTFDALEKGGFAVEFYFDSKQPISEVHICMYGKTAKIYDYVKDWPDWIIDFP